MKIKPIPINLITANRITRGQALELMKWAESIIDKYCPECDKEAINKSWLKSGGMIPLYKRKEDRIA